MAKGKQNLEDAAREFSCLVLENQKETSILGSLREMAWVREIDGYTGKNYFDCERNLIARMKKAYQLGNLPALDAVPLFLNTKMYPDLNTLRSENSASFINTYEGTQPFGNETSGQHTWRITNILRINILFNIYKKEIKEYHLLTLSEKEAKVNERANPFLQSLFGEVDIIQGERMKVKDKIMADSEYQSLKSEKDKAEIRRNRDKDLRKLYRNEEFNFRNDIISLCERTEKVFALASDFYESLKKHLS